MTVTRNILSSAQGEVRHVVNERGRGEYVHRRFSTDERARPHLVKRLDPSDLLLRIGAANRFAHVLAERSRCAMRADHQRAGSQRVACTKRKVVISTGCPSNWSPTVANRSLLVSAKTMNPGALAAFRKDGGKLVLEFDLGQLAQNANETARKLLNLIVVAVGTDDAPFTATFSASKPVLGQAVDFDGGVALSNAGALAGGNGGVPLPLTAFVGADVDQVFTFALDADANPGADLSGLHEVLLMAEYEAAI